MSDSAPSQVHVDRMWNYARKYAEKSGTYLHPDTGVTEAVVQGLARHIELVGKPLCPCNFYPDPKEEAKLIYVAMTRAMEMLLMTCSRETEFVKRIKEARSRVVAS